MSGKIDVSILTTGLSSSMRKRRTEVAQALKALIKGKGKVTTLNFQKVFTELRESMTELVGSWGEAGATYFGVYSENN